MKLGKGEGRNPGDLHRRGKPSKSQGIWERSNGEGGRVEDEAV